MRDSAHLKNMNLNMTRIAPEARRLREWIDTHPKYRPNMCCKEGAGCGTCVTKCYGGNCREVLIEE